MVSRMLLTLLASALALVVGVTLLWVVGTRIGDVSIIDVFWGFGFVLVAVLTLVVAGGDPPRRALLAVLTGVWGLRLGGYLAWRARGRGEDRRYTAMRKRVAGSFAR